MRIPIVKSQRRRHSCFSSFLTSLAVIQTPSSLPPLASIRMQLLHAGEFWALHCSAITMLWKHTGKLFWPHFSSFSCILIPCTNNRYKIRILSKVLELRSKPSMTCQALRVTYRQLEGGSGCGWGVDLECSSGLDSCPIPHLFGPVPFPLRSFSDDKAVSFSSAEMKSLTGWGKAAPPSLSWGRHEAFQFVNLWNFIALPGLYCCFLSTWSRS